MAVYETSGSHSNVNQNATESYSIINQIGQEVKRGVISNQEKIDIEDFTNGLYILKFDNGNSLKFIKL